MGGSKSKEASSRTETLPSSGTSLSIFEGQMPNSNSEEASSRIENLPTSSTPVSNFQGQVMDSGSKELLGVEPSELRFLFEAKTQLYCSLQLRNRTDEYIAFKVKTTSPNRYSVRPNKDILPPLSICDVIVTRQAQREAPRPYMEGADKFLVQSAVVREGTTIKDLTYEMFESNSGNVVDKVKLSVVWVQPPQKTSPVQNGSEGGSSSRPSWFDGGNTNYQDTESTQHSVLLQHLKDITSNFCDERILGRGGFGVVYKGVLGNGKVIAVKKFVQSMSSSHEQFENEVNLLRKLEHNNIVRLLGFCYQTQPSQKRHEGKFIFAWDIECLLCLEYLPKGSLDKYISDPSSGIDWPTRYKIIQGISNGLNYLHEQSGGPIVHLDLKPGNILLDENMIPKITDFGLSRLFDQEQTIYTIITRGTFGYMPPEYLRGIITPMSDIFSLGVLILEVITGHRNYPYDIRTSSTEFIELELQRWRNVLQKEPGHSTPETDCQQIKRCIQIGLICVNPERTKRPTMKKIIDMLQGFECMDWYITNELTAH